METDSYVYDAFGAVTSSTGTTSNDWLFTGEQRDGDTELYFLRARYYDPEIGRFLGRDPIEFAQRYAYVGNNPVAYTDPSGLEGEESGCYYHYSSNPTPSDYLLSSTRCNTYSSDTTGFHQTLDACGFIWVVGELCDGINSISYAFEGEWFDAGISGLAILPLGDAFKAARIARRFADSTGAIPTGWARRPADNNAGWVWQRSGAIKNADQIRIMDPTDQYEYGYVRFYNSSGQPLTLAGKPGPRSETHIPIQADGSFARPAGWP